MSLFTSSHFASASAQGSASLECTPPSLDIQFEFAAGVEGSAKAEFLAKMGELRVRGIAILQGTAKLGALITGEIDGEVVFDPAPLAQLTGSLNGIVSAGAEGSLFADVPKGKILCVIPAMQAAVEALGSVGAEASGTIQAQAMFASFITTGN